MAVSFEVERLTAYLRSNRVSQYAVKGDLTLDDSYSFGGEDISTDIDRHFSDVYVALFDAKAGYQLEYDRTNKKVKVFEHAPPIVYEEKHTVPATPFKITLRYPAAAIMNVASASVGYDMIEASDVLASGEVQLTAAMAEGVRTGLTFHSEVGAVYVTYITQAWREVWLNRKAAQVVATASHVAKLGKVACFIESCLAVGTTGSSKPGYTRKEDAAATTEAEVDFTDSAGTPANTTTLTFYGTDAVTGITITYIELPSSGFLFDRFLEDQDNTIASGASTALNPLHPILFHGLGGGLPDWHAANEQAPYTNQMLMGDACGTAGEFAINYQQRPAVGVTDHIAIEDSTADAISLTYVWGIPSDIPGVVPLEVRDGTDLSDLAVRFVIIGEEA